MQITYYLTFEHTNVLSTNIFESFVSCMRGNSLRLIVTIRTYKDTLKYTDSNIHIEVGLFVCTVMLRDKYVRYSDFDIMCR